MDVNNACDVVVALIPDVSSMRTDLTPLPECGAGVTFIGSARLTSPSRGRGDVRHLHFEAYDRMALEEMERIAHAAATRWSLHRVHLLHRTGRVEIGEAAIIVHCDAPHRAGTFDACRWIVDEVKRSVPIWKQEQFTDNSCWVEPHP